MVLEWLQILKELDQVYKKLIKRIQTKQQLLVEKIREIMISHGCFQKRKNPKRSLNFAIQME